MLNLFHLFLQDDYVIFNFSIAFHHTQKFHYNKYFDSPQEFVILTFHCISLNNPDAPCHSNMIL